MERAGFLHRFCFVPKKKLKLQCVAALVQLLQQPRLVGLGWAPLARPVLWLSVPSPSGHVPLGTRGF